MEQVFRRGLAAFRWVSWIWIAVTLIIYWHTDYLRHKWLDFVLVILALISTAIATALVPQGGALRNRRLGAGIELLLGFALMTLDGLARRKGVVFDNGPTIGSWWPVIVLMSASTYLPLWGAGICGALFGVARLFSTWFNGIAPTKLSGGEILSVADTGLFCALAAVSVSGLMKLLRTAEMEVAVARARNEVARTLHDGVLQTLAVVERRSGDEQLSRLAREQELELRRYLFAQDAGGEEQEELGSALLKAAARFEDIYGGRVNTVLALDLPAVAPAVGAAVAGAVGEALTNAGKHGEATLVTVYVEPGDNDKGLFCSVKDNGKGFDVETASERVGLSSSIKGRIAEVGGRVEIKSTVGDGAEILIWV